MGPGVPTHHVALTLLLIEQLARLAHRHSDERGLAVPRGLTARPLLAGTASGEHLQGIHGRGRAESRGVMLLIAALIAVHLLMCLLHPLLVQWLLLRLVAVLAQEGKGGREDGGVSGGSGLFLSDAVGCVVVVSAAAALRVLVSLVVALTTALIVSSSAALVPLIGTLAAVLVVASSTTLIALAVALATTLIVASLVSLVGTLATILVTSALIPLVVTLITPSLVPLVGALTTILIVPSTLAGAGAVP